MKIAFLVPAYRPGQPLVDVVKDLRERSPEPIIVVDDGSGPDFRTYFEECQRWDDVHVLRHDVNQGKGAALKTGIEYSLSLEPECAGVVTADADGQHHPDDILAVARKLAENPDSLVMGVREFSGEVPLRSRFGNTLTRHAFRLLLGVSLTDTQTGLRGIPRSLIPKLLEIKSTGYEFELDMLIACRHQNCPVVEQGIRTIYLDENRSSHFSPVLDSMKIYFVLMRFGALSLLTAGVDNIVFFLLHTWTGSVPGSLAGGRVVAVLFNYLAVRKAVFLSDERHRTLLPKYLLLVCCSGLASYGLIRFLSGTYGVPVIYAKLIAESILFFVNFVIQRDVIFTTSRKAPASMTDWTEYYSSTPLAARVTRRYTRSVLVDALKRHTDLAGSGGTLVEVGGGNSCFLDRVAAEFRPGAYHVVDSNKFSLDLLSQRLDGSGNVVLHERDVLDSPLNLQADAAFSVGLVEHFDAVAAREVIRRHFDLVRPGGSVIISYATPTPLYRFARRVSEALRLWRFPDERPLRREEMLAAAADQGQVVFEKTLWFIVFTQRMTVIKKPEAAIESGAGSAQ